MLFRYLDSSCACAGIVADVGWRSWIGSPIVLSMYLNWMQELSSKHLKHLNRLESTMFWAMRKLCKTRNSKLRLIILRNRVSVIIRVHVKRSSQTHSVQHQLALVWRQTRSSKLTSYLHSLSQSLLKLNSKTLRFQRTKRRKTCSVSTLKSLMNYQN